MKKFRFLSLMLLALALVFAAACGGKQPESDALLDAKNMLHGMYKDDSASTPDDYELIYQVLVDGVPYKVTWTVEVKSGNPEDVKVVEQAGKKTVIDVNKYAEEEVQYVLKATISDEKGNTLSQSYDKVLPAFKTTSWAEYAAAEEGALVNVQGVITAFGGSASSVTVYFEDENGGYYGYGLKVSEEVYAQLEVGKTILASGEKDLYNGTFEVVNGTLEILDIAKKEVAPKDITAIFDDAADAYDPRLQALQGSYVTIKQAEMDKIDGKYYYFTKGAVNMYVYASSSSVFVDAAGMATLAEKTVKGQAADITGVVGMYNGAIQIIPLTTDAITHVTVELSDQEVLNKAKDIVNELAGQVYAKDLDLLTSTPQGATIAWTSANTELISNEGKLGNYPLEETAVKLTAVITAGSLTETVEIEVKVAALTKSTIAAAQAACDQNNVVIWLEGKLIGLDKNGYGFIADETGAVYVRTKFEGFAIGDSVKVIGTATQYTSKQYTRQISNATITKLDTEVKVATPVKIEIADLGAPTTNEEVMATRYYGMIVTVTGYVTVRGSYSNVYISVANDQESAAIQYWYTLPADVVAALQAYEGKLVTVTAPIYNWSQSNGWALGAALEIVEGEKELAKEEGAVSIEEAYALAKDTEVVVEATVKFVNPGTGLIVTDGTNNLFVYTKADLSTIKAGDLVVVKGKMGSYNQAPQVTGNPTVTLKATGKYEATPEAKTMEEVNALDYNDPKNFGKEFKVTGKPVVSGNYVNFQVGETTYSLYLSNADKETLKAYADKEIEIVVLTYNYKGKINLFADVTTIVEK